MDPYLCSLIDQLEQEHTLSASQWIQLLNGRTPELAAYLFEKSRRAQIRFYGHTVYIRGLIEFTNYCKNNCYYCGIRSGNTHAHRYRLTKEDILACCADGYKLGFRTFVLQGGEDPWYTTDRLSDLVHTIRTMYPDCAITLSTGEATKAEYQQLKEIGYQVGTGFMVGSPGQTSKHLAEDLLFLKELNPQMVGIGPFIPHHDTPFAKQKAGTLELTLFLLGLIRLILPKVLLPATTALGTIAPNGRELGILSGANVVMPNLSPKQVRGDYLLYDNKISTDAEAAECRAELEQRMQSIGYQVITDRGDSLNITP